LAENSEALKTRIPVVRLSPFITIGFQRTLPTLFSAVLKTHPLGTHLLLKGITFSWWWQCPIIY